MYKNLRFKSWLLAVITIFGIEFLVACKKNTNSSIDGSISLENSASMGDGVIFQKLIKTMEPEEDYKKRIIEAINRNNEKNTIVFEKDPYIQEFLATGKVTGLYVRKDEKGYRLTEENDGKKTDYIPQRKDKTIKCVAPNGYIYIYTVGEVLDDENLAAAAIGFLKESDPYFDILANSQYLGGTEGAGYLTQSITEGFMVDELIDADGYIIWRRDGLTDADIKRMLKKLEDDDQQ